MINCGSKLYFVSNLGRPSATTQQFAVAPSERSQILIYVLEWYCVCRMFSILYLGLLLLSVSGAAQQEAAKEECLAAGDSSFLPPKPIPRARLHNGVQMPTLSLGMAHFTFGSPLMESNRTYIGFYPERTYRQAELALQQGIRSFDTALMYGTQPHLGHVLGEWWRAGQLQSREDVFITTKVFHAPAPGFGLEANHQVHLETMSPEDVTLQTTRHIEQCLKELGVGYIDLLLMHWPSVAGQSEEISRQRRLAAWKVFEEFYQRGWLRAIGVSNFSEKHLEQLREDGASIQPMVNQIEASPYLQHTNIVKYCQKHSIVVQAYSPLGSGLMDVKDDKLLLELAAKYQKDVGQLVFRYLIQKGYVIAYKTSNAGRMESNQDVFDNFELSKEDVAKIDALNRVNGSFGLPSPYDLP